MTITVRTIFSINPTDGSHDFLVIRRGPAGISIEAHSREDEWESATAGPFTPEQLRAALDEVAPAGSYTRTTPHPDDMDGGVTAALIEKEADTRTREHLLHEESCLLNLERSLRSHLSRTINRAEKAEKERDEAVEALGTTLGRAMKAERERDEARATIDALREEAHACDVHNGVVIPGPRPLTADAITDEMVEGARARLRDTYSVDLDPAEVHEILTAALTEPPARPEGAEDIEALLDDYHEDDLTLTGRLNVAPLADYLAGRGVRAVAEERS